jgi:shikimate kinase
MLGMHPSFTIRAIERGAFAAGLSGKGPAEVALVHADLLHRFRDLQRTSRLVELNPGGAA